MVCYGSTVIYPRVIGTAYSWGKTHQVLKIGAQTNHILDRAARASGQATSNLEVGYVATDILDAQSLHA